MSLNLKIIIWQEENAMEFAQNYDFCIYVDVQHTKCLQNN